MQLHISKKVVQGWLKSYTDRMEPNHPREIGNYNILSEIGRGSTSTVYRAMNKLDNEIVAIKCIDIKKNVQSRKISKERIVEMVNNEFSLMNCFRHPNILRIEEIPEPSDFCYIVMKYYNKETLLSLLLKNPEFFSEKEVAFFMLQMLIVLVQLRDQAVIHRDIKLENILVDDKIYVLADFGCSRFSDSSEMTSFVGTYYTMAPEVHEGNYDLRADIFSIGCCMFRLLFRGEFTPWIFGSFPANMTWQEKISASAGENLKFFAKENFKKVRLSKECADFLFRVTDPNPKTRITLDDCFKHPFFGLHLPEFEKYEVKSCKLAVSEFKLLKNLIDLNKVRDLRHIEVDKFEAAYVREYLWNEKMKLIFMTMTSKIIRVQRLLFSSNQNKYELVSFVLISRAIQKLEKLIEDLKFGNEIKSAMYSKDFNRNSLARSVIKDFEFDLDIYKSVSKEFRRSIMAELIQESQGKQEPSFLDKTKQNSNFNRRADIFNIVLDSDKSEEFLRSSFSVLKPDFQKLEDEPKKLFCFKKAIVCLFSCLDIDKAFPMNENKTCFNWDQQMPDHMDSELISELFDHICVL